MTTRTVTVTHKGWFYFCPCYLPEGFEEADDLAPLPRYRLSFLLDAAFGFAQCLNWCLSWFGKEGGFMVAGVRPLRAPKRITFRAAEED